MQQAPSRAAVSSQRLWRWSLTDTWLDIARSEPQAANRHSRSNEDEHALRKKPTVVSSGLRQSDPRPETFQDSRHVRKVLFGDGRQSPLVGREWGQAAGQVGVL